MFVHISGVDAIAVDETATVMDLLAVVNSIYNGVEKVVAIASGGIQLSAQDVVGQVVGEGDALTMVLEGGGRQKRHFDDEDYVRTEVMPSKRHHPDPLAPGFLPVEIWMYIFSFLLPPTTTSVNSEPLFYCKWTFVPYNRINKQCREAVEQAESIGSLSAFKYIDFGNLCQPQRMWAYEHLLVVRHQQDTDKRNKMEVPSTVHSAFDVWRRVTNEFSEKLKDFVQILCEAALTDAEVMPFGLASTKELELLRSNQNHSPAKLHSLNWDHLAHRLPSHNRTKLTGLVQDLTLAHHQATACYAHMIEHCNIDDVVQRCILTYILALDDLNHRRQVFAMKREQAASAPRASPIGWWQDPCEQYHRLRTALLQEFSEQCVDIVLDTPGVDLDDQVAVFMRCLQVAALTDAALMM